MAPARAAPPPPKRPRSHRLSLSQRSFTLILQAHDDHNGTEGEDAGLIEEAWWSGIVEPGAAWHALRHAGARAALAYRVRVTCAPNYYNATCTTFCRARDDKFGHYGCDDTGAKRCLPGWRGDNCEQRTYRARPVRDPPPLSPLPFTRLFLLQPSAKRAATRPTDAATGPAIASE